MFHPFYIFFFSFLPFFPLIIQFPPFSSLSPLPLKSFPTGLEINPHPPPSRRLIQNCIHPCNAVSPVPPPDDDMYDDDDGEGEEAEGAENQLHVPIGRAHHP